MGYKVISAFKEKGDNDRIYNVGDVYPHEDYKPTKKRIEELTTKHPKYKRVFLEEVDAKEVKSTTTKKSKPAVNKE